MTRPEIKGAKNQLGGRAADDDRQVSVEFIGRFADGVRATLAPDTQCVPSCRSDDMNVGAIAARQAGHRARVAPFGPREPLLAFNVILPDNSGPALHFALNLGGHLLWSRAGWHGADLREARVDVRQSQSRPQHTIETINDGLRRLRRHGQAKPRHGLHARQGF